MKIISVIGYSGSGKTYLIINAIKQLHQKVKSNCSVIKNIHKHKIDKEGKDSYKFMEAGANYCITRNIFNENTIFTNKEFEFPKLIKWIEKGPFTTDILFIEGFRNLPYPTILCIKNIEEIDPQLNKNVKMISGIILSKKINHEMKEDIPFIDVIQDFSKFRRIFEI